MGRSPKAAAEAPPPPAGHNNAKLTEDEASALTIYYELKVREDQRKVDALMVDLKSARSVVNGHFKRMTADLGFTRKDFEAEVIAKANMTEAEYMASERKRARLHRLSGRNPGEQLDLISDVLADTIDDAIAAEANGYCAGRRADDPLPPKEIHGTLQQDWLRGYHKGQEVNGMALAKAAEILARPKPGEMAAEPEAAEAEEDDGDPEVIKRKANALKDGGWTDPTPAEAEFADA